MIVDFHTHVFPYFFRDKGSALFPHEPAFKALYNSPGAKLVGVGELIRSMDEQGIQRSVIFGFPWDKADHFRRHNDYILESIQQYSDRLIGFCTFSPLSQDGPREVERCLTSGLLGVGELAVYGAGISSRVTGALREVMALCLRFDVPVLLHTNEPVGHEYAGKGPMTLRQIYAFCKAYPQNRIILAHWGGGLVFYGLLKKDVEVTLKNVWFDTAASPYLYRPDIYRIAGEIIGFERILFGSDYPLLKPRRYFDEMNQAHLPQKAYTQITGLNAVRVLGLSD